nr:hypothetical transcript [Hymenolepis microstoma]
MRRASDHVRVRVGPFPNFPSNSSLIYFVEEGRIKPNPPSTETRQRIFYAACEEMGLFEPLCVPTKGDPKLGYIVGDPVYAQCHQ